MLYREVEIGWTFLASSHWGGATNRGVRRLMLDHALLCRWYSGRREEFPLERRRKMYALRDLCSTASTTLRHAAMQDEQKRQQHDGREAE
jgi:hypothetical protein